MTLEIPTELEAQLERAMRNMSAEDYVIQLVRDATEQSEIERLAAIRRFRGSVSGGSPIVDEFLQECSKEGRREAQKEETLWNNRANS